MPFIGNSNTTQAFTPAIDYFSGNASTVAFTLSRPVASVAQVQVVIENVPQNPSSAFTVSGNTITFTSAPPTGTNNIYVNYTSPITQINPLTQSPSVLGPMYVGINGATPIGGATNPIVGMSGAANNYVQAYAQNTNNSVNSSADFVAYPSNGTDSAGWVDMGITSLSYNQAAYSVTGPNESYLFGSAPAGSGTTGNLVLATDSTGTANAIQFYTGGFTQAKSAARMTIDGSGNVGIGTASPSSYGKLVSYGAFGTSAPALSIVNSSAENANNIAETQYWLGNSFSGLVNVAKIGAISGTTGNQYGSLYFSTSSAGAPTERMRIDSSGNVGIGTASPSNLLTLFKNSGAYSLDLNGAGFGTLGRFGVVNVGTDNTTYIGSISNNPFAFYSNAVERMRIDSSGNLLVGKTSTATTALGWNLSPVAGNAKFDTGQYFVFNRDTNDILINFRRSDTSVGNINVTTTATAYVTSSDYRLKEEVKPMSNALDKIAQLKPCIYKWKIDGSDGEGFIAHELAEVMPQAVSGEKDAVNEDGSIKAQGIDTSFLVATLTAAIQEQQTMIEELKTKVLALEAK